jgi:hypothetical protein
MLQQIDKVARKAIKLEKKNGIVRLTKSELVAMAQVGGDKLPGNKVDGNKDVKDVAAEQNLLKAHRDLAIVEEQKLTGSVESSLRQARKQLNSDPDAAYELIRNTLIRVRDHANLNEKLRETMLNQLQNSLRDITLQGTQVKLKLAQQQLLDIQAAKIQEGKLANMAEVARTEARFRVFKNMMNAARFERYTEEKVLDGLREMQVEAMYKGLPVPPVTQAAYSQVSANYNLQVQVELRRKRELGFLAVMLEVEKSHVPFADEPPMHFPPLAVWEAIRKLRKEKYEVSSLPDDDVGRKESLAVSKMLEEMIDMKDFQQPGGISLKDTLSLFYEKMAAKGKELPILIDTDAFKGDGDAPDVYDTVIRFPISLRKMTLRRALEAAIK